MSQSESRPDEAKPKPRSRRRGSSFSDKQISASVKDGKRVSVLLSENEGVLGYICGSDDYHWGVVDKDAVVTLVHKTAPALSIASKPTLDCESDAVKSIVNAYREHVLQHTYGYTSASQKEARS